MNKKIGALAFGMLLSFIAISCWAGDWYAGGGVGISNPSDAQKNLDDLSSLLTSGGVASNFSYDKNALAGGAFAGYQFTPNVAIEGGYEFLGSFDASFSASGISATERDIVQVATLSGVFTAPIGAFSLYGRIGIAATTTELRGDTNISTSESRTDSKTSPLLGLGIGLKAAKKMTIRLDVERFSSVGNTDEDFTAGPFITTKLELVFGI